MEHVYALGVECIESIQYWFSGWSGYLELVNHLANPRYVIDVLFPLISIVDSVFASQLLLCMSFGGWLNGVMKWWLLEDRPYWWVQETTFYANSHRPHLMQTPQTCETGPGSPSGHSDTAASLLMLTVMWISHVFNDRKCDVRWWKAALYPLLGAALGSVLLARVFVAAHFPHQCLLGFLVGLFTAPALCIYVSDPFIWRYGSHGAMRARDAVAWHVACVALVALITVVTYCSLVMCDVDPNYTVQLAHRWCAYPDSIHVSTTPLFALVKAVASLLGWALCVTPAVAQYRHYTKNRSLTISIIGTALSIYLMKQFDAHIANTSGFGFYVLHFIQNVIKPAILLRVVPVLAMWPYIDKYKQKVS